MDLEYQSWRKTISWIQRDALRYDEHPSGFLMQSIKNLYSHPAFLGIVYYRLGRWAWSNRSNPFHGLLYILYRIIYPLIRLLSGVELQARANIGPGLCILHFGPVVIHPDTIAGENLTILPAVIIGKTKGGTPCLGNNVSLGSGVSVLGPINIGSHVNIGAGAVAIHNLPSNCTAVGIPARPVPVELPE